MRPNDRVRCQNRGQEELKAAAAKIMLKYEIKLHIKSITIF